MITYGTVVGGPPANVKEFLAQSKGVPNLIDVGENTDAWIRVNRMRKKVEFVSKESGRVVSTCPADDVGLLATVMGPGIRDAVAKALAL